MSQKTDVDTAIQSLQAIKAGQDPRQHTAEPDTLLASTDDPLELAREETDRLWDEHDLHEIVPRALVSVAVAEWDRRNGVAKYDQIPVSARNGRRMQTRRARGEYTIGVNVRIDDRSDFIDTVRHEVAHVVDYVERGESDHSRAWKRWARRLGADPSAAHDKKETEYNYAYGCSNGCWSAGRIKRSKKITQAGRYRCNECDGRCVSWRVGDEPPEDAVRLEADRA